MENHFLWSLKYFKIKKVIIKFKIKVPSASIISKLIRKTMNPWKNLQFHGHLLNFQKNLRTMVIYREPSLWFLKTIVLYTKTSFWLLITMVMNIMEHFNNHGWFFLDLITIQHLLELAIWSHFEESSISVCDYILLETSWNIYSCLFDLMLGSFLFLSMNNLLF